MATTSRAFERVTARPFGATSGDPSAFVRSSGESAISHHSARTGSPPAQARSRGRLDLLVGDVRHGIIMGPRRRVVHEKRNYIG